MVKIAIIGASGKAGQAILKESTSRGYQVTAIVRNNNKLSSQTVHQVIEKNVHALTQEDLKPFDVVVNAFASAPGHESEHVKVGRHLINLLENTETRLIVVGGAGSLYADEKTKTRLLDTEAFPKEYLPIAQNQGKNLEDLRASENVNWTFISPAAIFDPAGERTGKYKTGKDNLVLNSENKSYISYADYAIAFVDEIESPKHLNSRFAVVSA
jgi:putative NADH-flavin reductase